MNEWMNELCSTYGLKTELLDLQKSVGVWFEIYVQLSQWTATIGWWFIENLREE